MLERDLSWVQIHSPAQFEECVLITNKVVCIIHVWEWLPTSGNVREAFGGLACKRGSEDQTLFSSKCWLLLIKIPQINWGKYIREIGLRCFFHFECNIKNAWPKHLQIKSMFQSEGFLCSFDLWLILMKTAGPVRSGAKWRLWKTFLPGH